MYCLDVSRAYVCIRSVLGKMNQSFCGNEHLQPHSIRVKAGEKINKGEVIAHLGFTGQTTGPHLHLHVADSDSPLGSEGLPFVFDQFSPLGGYPDFSTFGKSRWTPHDKDGPAIIKREYPAANTVISF